MYKSKDEYITDYEYMDDGDDLCHYCDGEGWLIVGVDWDSDDPINGPYNGEVERCPNCGGSGEEKYCWFW